MIRALLYSFWQTLEIHGQQHRDGIEQHAASVNFAGEQYLVHGDDEGTYRAIDGVARGCQLRFVSGQAGQAHAEERHRHATERALVGLDKLQSFGQSFVPVDRAANEYIVISVHRRAFRHILYGSVDLHQAQAGVSGVASGRQTR
jgi:hypothetical protein